MPPKLPTVLPRSISRTHPHPPLRPILALPTSIKPSPYTHHHHRPLTTTLPTHARGGKQLTKRTTPQSSPETPTDPFDLSDYEAAKTRAHEHLREELKRVRAGGLDAEGMEGVRVLVGGGRDEGGKGKGKGGREKDVGKGMGKEKGEMVRLGDLATVVKRGRILAVLVGEKDHIKPITTALSAPPHNHFPNPPSPSDPLTLTIPIPPTTSESRREAKEVAGRKGEEALFVLREARGGVRKRLRGLGLGRMIGPDELRRVEGNVEKINERAVGEAKRMVEGCKKGLEGG